MSVYAPYLDSLSQEEHRSLKLDMEELLASQGWAQLESVIGGNFTAYAESVVLTGEFDARRVGTAAGEKRVLSFPEYVIAAYDQRFDEDGKPRESQGAQG